ncbi:RING finger-containing E3 ubiquitin ligase [Banggai cardinalfish iridovirus]|uniref:RING finger-containing E3 ubiquitin ligase n=1 Tax=Banggai cardinalfish iridovirus TaxID=565290 RepID=A0A6M3QTM8_ISKNV|nr:RING finger-containing E3 ubiquitin ligase [Banggai cardinalfish iridovirus]UWH18802.1 RING-finger-containing E3 ubiquitin ligase [Infectious spleen and kidney necrosis virus]WEP24551.1 RING finger-containing E3 ubiquitin ligase [Largemouth bass ulcerative syndrome virus]
MECSICLTLISQSDDKRYGLVNTCNHPFCYICLCTWARSCGSLTGGERTCPVCRVPFNIVVPSTRWPKTVLDKRRIIHNYRAWCGKRKCRFDPLCYNEYCVYRHTYNIVW